MIQSKSPIEAIYFGTTPEESKKAEQYINSLKLEIDLSSLYKSEFTFHPWGVLVQLSPTKYRLDMYTQEEYEFMFEPVFENQKAFENVEKDALDELQRRIYGGGIEKTIEQGLLNAIYEANKCYNTDGPYIPDVRTMKKMAKTAINRLVQDMSFKEVKEAHNLFRTTWMNAIFYVGLRMKLEKMFGVDYGDNWYRTERDGVNYSIHVSEHFGTVEILRIKGKETVGKCVVALTAFIEYGEAGIDSIADIVEETIREFDGAVEWEAERKTAEKVLLEMHISESAKVRKEKEDILDNYKKRFSLAASKLNEMPVEALKEWQKNPIW